MNAPHPLVARYVHQIREHLPREGEDVAREIESLILDTLDHRSGGTPPSDELVVEVLREFGDPATTASRYAQLAPRMLFEPHVLPAFSRIVTWTPIGLAALYLLLFLLTTFSGRAGVSLSPGVLGEWLLSYATTVVFNLGLLVALFVVISRLPGRTKAAPDARAPFDPRTLPPLPAHVDADKISFVWTVTRTYVFVVLLLGLNVFPQWMDLLSLTISDGKLVPLGDLGLRLPSELLNTWWLSGLLLNLALLAHSRWTTVTRLFAAATAVFGALVLCSIALHDTGTATGFEIPRGMVNGIMWGNAFALFATGASHLVRSVSRWRTPSAAALTLLLLAAGGLSSWQL